MDHEIRVSVTDGSEHVQEEPDTRVDPQASLHDELVDGLSLDVLEHQVWLAARRDAGIEQSGDSRVSESGEHRAFVAKASLSGCAEEREVEQLHGGLALEPAVGSAGEPHRSHTTAPERTLEGIGANLESAQRHLRPLDEKA